MKRNYFEPLVYRLQMLRVLHTPLSPMRIFLRHRHYIEEGLQQVRPVCYIAAAEIYTFFAISGKYAFCLIRV